MSKIIFLDTETTGLDARRHEMWEFAAIVVDSESPDVVSERHHYFIYPDRLKDADPGALRVNNFYQRTARLGGQGWPVSGNTVVTDRWSTPDRIASVLAQLLDGATLVGSNPSFDEKFIEKFLYDNRQVLLSNHRKIDIVSMALGYLEAKVGSATDDEREVIHEAIRLPHSSRKVLDAAGCPPNEAAHTAMGDAEHVWDAWMHLRGLA